MPKPLSQWTLCELCRIAERDPQRVDRLAEALWTSHPRLLGELAISAVDHNELTLEEAAEVLNVSVEEVRSRVETFRRAERPTIPIIDEQGIARLAEGQVPVWEVVREHRKCGSMEELAKAFPALTETELLAAIAYGEHNGEAIDKLIERYEDMQGRKRSEYPFAR